MRLLLCILLLGLVSLSMSSCTCRKPEWELVFKIVAGIATPSETDPLILDPYAIWNRDAPYNEDVAEARCLDTTYKGHFKSPLITNWDRRDIQEVKLALLNDTGHELISLIYDADGASKTGWFTASRILESPWNDILTATRNYDSILGHENHKRRFFINSEATGCSTDAGWLVIAGQNSPPCAWEQNHARPQILYSTQTTFSNWNDAEKIGSASIFAIFIKNKCAFI